MFKNLSPTCPAGKLIDELGLKGLRIGGAEISQVHANFIVNPQRTATVAEVTALVRRIRRTAWTQRQIVMELEVETWNCPAELHAHPETLLEADTCLR